MIDWQDKVERGKLICNRSQQNIEPGSYYYSRLLFIENRFVREDFTEEAWLPEDAEHALSWWHHRRPQANADNGPRIVNSQVLIQIFADIKDTMDRGQQCFAWLLGLLLMRMKKLRYLGIETEGDGTVLLLEHKAHKVVYRVRDPEMSAKEEERVQNDLSDVFDMPAESLNNEESAT